MHKLVLRLPDVTPTEFHQVDSGQCGCVFRQLSLHSCHGSSSSCRCDGESSAPFRLPLRHRQLPTKPGRSLFLARPAETHFGWCFVCGRHLPFRRTFFWYDLGLQELRMLARACIELFCSLNERTFRKVVSEGPCTLSSRARRCALSRIGSDHVYICRC